MGEGEKDKWSLFFRPKIVKITSFSGIWSVRDWAVSIYSGYEKKTVNDLKRQRITVKVHIHLDGEFARGRSCHTWSEKRRLRERGLLRLLYLKVRSHKADHSDSLTLTEVKRCHRRTHTFTTLPLEAEGWVNKTTPETLPRHTQKQHRSANFTLCLLHRPMQLALWWL